VGLGQTSRAGACAVGLKGRWRTGKAHPTDETPRRYDRVFLLSAEQRNQVLEMWEMQCYSPDSFADPDYVHRYEVPPAE
jgi:hypothetical protein